MLKRHIFSNTLYASLRSQFNLNIYKAPTYCFSRNRRNDPFRNKNKDEEEEEEILTLKDIQLPREKIETNFSRSSGPGGQNVNKLNTKAEIRFNITTCTWLEDDVKKRLRELNKNAINNKDEIIVTSQLGRTQTQNLEDAFDKMRVMVYQASLPEKEKRNDIPAETNSETRRRIQDKRKRSEVKKSRSGNGDW